MAHDDIGRLNVAAEALGAVEDDRGTAEFSSAETSPISTLLDEQTLGELKAELLRTYDQAKSDKSEDDTRVARYRQKLAMVQGVDHAGDSTETLPYSAGKVQGAKAHFREALNLDPFFVTRPYTKEAAANADAWETMMERELDRSRTRRQLWLATNEAVDTGTGLLAYEVSEVNGEWVIGARAVTYENFFCAPDTDLYKASTFEEFAEPFYVLRQRAERGVYDPDAVELVRNSPQDAQLAYDQRVSGRNQAMYEGEQRMIRLTECFFRWGNDDIGYYLWRIIYNRAHNVILRAEHEHAFTEAFGDSPPYENLRVRPQAYTMFGVPYMQFLEPIQQLMDWVFHSKVSYDKLAITPITFVDENVELFNKIDEGLTAGDIVEVRGEPGRMIWTYNPPQSGEPENMLNILRSLGEDATFSDLQLQGLPTNTVRSATEISGMLSAAQKKLSTDLADLSDDLADFAKRYWKLIFTYKIKDQGVVPVFQGSDQYLIANQEISQEDLIESILEFMGMEEELPQDPLIYGQAIEMITEQFKQMGYDFFISSADREDMEWLPNGARLVADKQMVASKLLDLVREISANMMLIRQDRGVYNMYRDVFKNMGIYNWKDYLPYEPPLGNAEPQQIAEAANMSEQVRRGGG